jgi:hypothetical protein
VQPKVALKNKPAQKWIGEAVFGQSIVVPPTLAEEVKREKWRSRRNPPTATLFFLHAQKAADTPIA